MKIALVGHKPAYPKIDGGCVASAAFLQNLIDAQFDVHYFMLSTEKHPFEIQKFPADVSAKVKLSAFQINTRIRPIKALKCLFSKKSYNVERFYSRNFESLLSRSILHERFDVVIFDNVFAARYLSVFQEAGIRSYVRTHNVEYKIWEDFAHTQRNPIKKRYLQKLAKDLKSFELKALKNSDRLLTISTDDLKDFQENGVSTEAIVIPVGIEIPNYKHDYSKSSLFHLGAMNWIPNIEAVDLVIGILPELKVKLPEVQFTVAGQKSDLRYDTDRSKGIIAAGFVQSVEEFITSEGILVTPIQSGSGVRIKILEMMAFGVPVITTTLGAQGIEDLKGLLIANSKEELIQSIYELVNDDKKRENLGMNAKSVINLHYNPNKITAKVLEFIQRT